MAIQTICDMCGKVLSPDRSNEVTSSMRIGDTVDGFSVDLCGDCASKLIGQFRSMQAFANSLAVKECIDRLYYCVRHKNTRLSDYGKLVETVDNTTRGRLSQ